MGNIPAVQLPSYTCQERRKVEVCARSRRKFKVTKIKAAVKLYRNGDPAMAIVREFDERAEELGHSSVVKEAARYAEEMGLQLQLEHPIPTSIKRDSREVITTEKLKAELRKC